MDRKLKPFLLVVTEYDDEDNVRKTIPYFFPTIKDAIERAPELVTPESTFGIYNLYSQGKIPKIQWELNTSPVANAIENKKVDDANKSNGFRKGAYSKRETDLLVEAFNDGFSADDMAEMLHRGKPSVVARLHYLGLSIKKRDAELKKG